MYVFKDAQTFQSHPTHPASDWAALTSHKAIPKVRQVHIGDAHTLRRGRGGRRRKSHILYTYPGGKEKEKRLTLRSNQSAIIRVASLHEINLHQKPLSLVRVCVHVCVCMYVFGSPSCRHRRWERCLNVYVRLHIYSNLSARVCLRPSSRLKSLFSIVQHHSHDVMAFIVHMLCCAVIIHNDYCWYVMRDGFGWHRISLILHAGNCGWCAKRCGRFSASASTHIINNQ